MPMNLNTQKEQFSIAYMRAVAAAAGYKATKPDVDDTSVDLHLEGYLEDGMSRSPALDVQLKCTANDHHMASDQIHFDLERKNYDDLRETRVLTPRILVVVIVPTDLKLWLVHNEKELLLRHCGYWLNLTGLPAVQQQKKRVFLHRTNVLSHKTLQELINHIGKTGSLP